MKKVKEIEHARKIEHINRTIVEIGKKNETEYKGKQRELGQAHSIIGKNAINRESLPKVGTTRQKRPDKMLIDTEKPTRNNKMRILNSKCLSTRKNLHATTRCVFSTQNAYRHGKT
eukprot:CAMPEP_0168519162 /NCGR_PEP_ID=MMETSP0405-20121227/7153_1 /TAXON_ID=498012 /ORGANISM="Trichosphaerium sp, Strain Am-I-7 wt" /LENGTH=115 /DNA_ID=CAMNT_0008539651 /DNA_START=320 /DNA_END=664 /DNA_ORIENTATION=-